jgi:hypothetical protein
MGHPHPSFEAASFAGNPQLHAEAAVSPGIPATPDVDVDAGAPCPRALRCLAPRLRSKRSGLALTSILLARFLRLTYRCPHPRSLKQRTVFVSPRLTFWALMPLTPTAFHQRQVTHYCLQLSALDHSRNPKTLSMRSAHRSTISAWLTQPPNHNTEPLQLPGQSWSVSSPPTLLLLNSAHSIGDLS